jgi:DNA-binding CsgD family transcriptional regulator
MSLDGPALRASPEDVSAPASPALARHITAITQAIGSSAFGKAVLDFLADTVRFDSALIVYYRRSSRPNLIGERFDHALRENTLQGYLHDAYRIDPVFSHSRAVEIPEIVRTRDLVDRQFEETTYFRTYYVKSNVADEINLLMPVQDGRVFAISLERSRGDVVFSAQEISKLRTWLDWLVAIFKLHRQATGELSHPEEADAEVEQLDRLLARFGEDILTPREQEVAALILNGYSVSEIGRDLGVSIETVRVHRRNIYEKLDVTSLAELFFLALQTVDAIRTGVEPPNL